MLFFNGLIAVTLMHTNATLFIAFRPLRPLAELAVDWAWNDLALLSLLLRSVAGLASMHILCVLAT
jgi:hypothetical protein